MILDLKQFNTHIRYRHFKIKSINQVRDIIRPNVYMTSIDLKDAFYSIPIHPEHQKYLKFVVLSKTYQYTCIPNDYGPVMRIFTKASKVPFSHLRSKGFVSVVFIDDSYLQGNTYKACLYNTESTTELLQNLGFTIHPTKSILSWVCHWLYSNDPRKNIREKNKIHNLCLEILQK